MARQFGLGLTGSTECRTKVFASASGLLAGWLAGAGAASSWPSRACRGTGPHRPTHPAPQPHTGHSCHPGRMSRIPAAVAPGPRHDPGGIPHGKPADPAMPTYLPTRPRCGSWPPIRDRLVMAATTGRAGRAGSGQLLWLGMIRTGSGSSRRRHSALALPCRVLRRTPASTLR
jgi:hypothetical protein